MYTGYLDNASFGNLHTSVDAYGLVVNYEEIGMSAILDDIMKYLATPEYSTNAGNISDSKFLDDENQQKSTDEEKLKALLNRVKVDEKIDIADFGNVIPSIAKKFISSLERSSKSEFKINRNLVGKGFINKNARISIEINGNITVGNRVKTGLKITSYGLPKSEITFANGEIHIFNSFIISGDKMIYVYNGNFYNTSTSGF